LGQCEDEAQLRAAVAQVVRGFTEESLAPLNLHYHICDKEGLQPVLIFGADFYPDMVIEVGSFPAVAFILKLIGEELELKISSAIGQALLYSQHYTAVIALILGPEVGEPHKHWLDWEFKADLWRRHKIKLIIREQTE
jgi:hypothetical protein